MHIRTLRRMFSCTLFLGFFLLSAESLAETATENLAAGSSAYDRGDLDAAIDRLNAAISIGELGKPELAQAHLVRGGAYLARGLKRRQSQKTLDRADDADIDQAIADLNASISLEPGNALTYYRRGLAYENKTPGYFAQAKADYSMATRLKPDFAEAYLNRGRLAWPNRDEALKDFNEAIRLNPQSPAGIKARLYRAQSLSNQGDLDHAIADYDAVINAVPESGPDHALALQERGRLRHKKGEFSSAIGDFSSLIAQQINAIRAASSEDSGPDAEDKLSSALSFYASAIAEKDWSLKFSGRNSKLDWPELEGAIPALEKALARVPSKREAVVASRAHTFYHRGEPQAAIQDYTSLIGISPPARYNRSTAGTGLHFDLPFLYRDRGIAYSGIGDFSQAIADFDDALQAWAPRAAFPDASIFNGRGVALLRSGEFSKAIADFDTVTKLKPDYAPSYANRGIAKLYAGQLGAEEDLAMAVRLGPPNPYWAIWLHFARFRAGNDDRNELAANAAHLDHGVWPWPVVQMLTGGGPMLSLPEVLPGDQLGRMRACEANFYAGMFALEKGETGKARELLKTAAGNCVPAQIEAMAAKVELKRID